MNYYSLDKEGKRKIRQAICDRAYCEIPYDGEQKIVNLGYGIAMGIINSIQGDKKRENGEILLQGESCAIGMDEFLNENDESINMHHVDPAGIPLKMHPLGCVNNSMADAFAFINSGKIYATFLGAFQVAADGSFANWDAGGDFKAGAGGAMALAKGVQNVIICMIEETRDGKSKLVEKCDLPLTAYSGTVKKIVTEKGVYIPNGNSFKKIETFNKSLDKYVKI